MSGAMTADELAAELGRSTVWLYRHWRQLVAKEAMPAPLHAGVAPLTWNRAQIYAWLDKPLSREQRAVAAAYRAAEAVARGSVQEQRIERDERWWQEHLDQQLRIGATGETT